LRVEIKVQKSKKYEGLKPNGLKMKLKGRPEPKRPEAKRPKGYKGLLTEKPKMERPKAKRKKPKCL
jgi:hypothetical protein